MDTTGLVYDRFVETVIGSVVGMLCVAIPWVWQVGGALGHPGPQP